MKIIEAFPLDFEKYNEIKDKINLYNDYSDL